MLLGSRWLGRDMRLMQRLAVAEQAGMGPGLDCEGSVKKLAIGTVLRWTLNFRCKLIGRNMTVW